MSDRVCIRGCFQRGVHYATCNHSGSDYKGAFPCKGCAPRECRDGSLICDGCFGRMRRLLEDAGDLLARLRSIGDPTKATAYDDVRVGRAPLASSAPSAPIGDDLLDAIGIVETAVRWAHTDLTDVSNDRGTMTYLGGLLLDRHAPDDDGLRAGWSVQDAVDRWGVERAEKPGAPAWEDDEASDEVVVPVHEWSNPLVGAMEAARFAGSVRTLQRWVKDGDVASAGLIVVAGARVKIFRAAELEEARDRAEQRRNEGRPKTTNQTNRSE